MIYKTILVLLTFFFLLGPVHRGKSQTPPPDNPIYIVQEGDSLTQIAVRFGITISELIRANSINDPNAISVGTKLIIPGFAGVSGVLTSVNAQLGETFKSILLNRQLGKTLFVRLNHITSPSEIYAGSSIIIPENQQGRSFPPLGSLRSGETLLELSIKTNSNPWTLVGRNNLKGSWDVIPGEMVFGGSSQIQKEVNPISPYISTVVVSPLPLIQGETAEIKIMTNRPVNLSGSLIDQKLNFFSENKNEYVAFQGIYRMTKQGSYPINLKGEISGEGVFNFEQAVLVVQRPRIEDAPLPVDPITTDPTITGPEDSLVNKIISVITPDRLWNGPFKSPVDVPNGYALFPDCTTDRFGNLRAYNNGPFDFFHSGIDLSACGNNLYIYASAPGKVVLSELLTVRGNYTLIDHGWGIYSGYGHQSEVKVKVGDIVEAGQLIGLIGKTGRVTGPHLHWEIWVNRVQVDPMDWINNTYP